MWPLDGGAPLTATLATTTWVPPCKGHETAADLDWVAGRLRYKLRMGDPDAEPDGLQEAQEADMMQEEAPREPEETEAAVDVARRRIRRLRGSGIAMVTTDHLSDLMLSDEELLELGLSLD